MAEKAEYAEDELELMLQHLDLMHHETREQTIARLQAALGGSKAAKPVEVSAKRGRKRRSA